MGATMRETPLFLGLTKPTKIFGLPIGYSIALVFLPVIPFILFYKTQHNNGPLKRLRIAVVAD